VEEYASRLIALVEDRRVRLHVSQWTYKQADPHQRRPTEITGGSVQIHDDEQFSVAITGAQDAKGFDTPDGPFTFTPQDGSVVTCQVSDDGLSALFVAGSPGSTVVDISDGANVNVTEAVDVLPAGAVTVTLSEGAAEKQPATA
jgi:hypothetical protein